MAQWGTVKEACGVFGVYAPGTAVAPLVFDGLFALQHRGQESAGMAVSDGDTITVVKEMGLVTSVFDARSLSSLQGHLALGHVRYSTTGPSTWHNAQPVYRAHGRAGFALGHNGNLTNVAALEDEAGMLPGVSGSDSDLIAELLAREFSPEGSEGDGNDLERALLSVLPRLEGAFSLGLMDERRLVAVRDPNGFRPLCLGRLDPEEEGGEGGWVVASESPALDIVGARFVRELAPGEMVVIDADGLRSSWPFAAERVDPRLCVFEFVYFARPDSLLYGRQVHAARHRMGERLAEESPVEADLVIGVPDSGVPAAEGFAARSGIRFGQGLVKNRYIGRTFIAPTQEARIEAVRRKLNPLRESIEGLRLIVVDDSVVRGTTTRQLIKMLREAGAAEVHLRISSPPFRWPCFYGIDTPVRDDLLAARMDVEEITRHLGADSVAYLSLDGLIGAIGVPGAGFCTACLTGDYPTAVPAPAGALVGTLTP
ncbi:MAG: amidophosphoribosyltransferase [Acidimicrobiaceae bacterium]|nr:amidophosphoribosyltransferase [Acidimicrobiaceae bacterium]